MNIGLKKEVFASDMAIVLKMINKFIVLESSLDYDVEKLTIFFQYMWRKTVSKSLDIISLVSNLKM